jgi:membrane fusion protein, multidrug efflux system
VRAGEAVRAGDPLVSLRPAPETGVAYAQAVSALRVANDSLQHTQRLLGEHLATAQQLTEAQKAVTDARVALQALESQGAGGPSVLRAPFDALVMHVTATGNQWVAEGTALLDLARAAGLILEAAVPPADAADIATGDVASVVPLGTTLQYPARVISRGAVIDADSGLIPVRVALSTHALPAGQSARAIITVGTVTGYLVPHSAVLLDDTGQSYVVQAVNAVARVVHVRVLAQQGDESAIDGPLQAGAPLVLAGNYQAEDGMHLRTGPAPPTAPTAPATH